MSVFQEFQKLWAERFPWQDDWEEDVRGLLITHRRKITELQNELEQENLYCSYLEKLLSDVEKIKKSTTSNNGINKSVDIQQESELDQVIE